MDMTENLKPLPMCEDCWLNDHSRWEPESINDEGSVIMKLMGVDVPHKVNTGEVEVCCMCGGLTVSGIYEFKDPSKVLFSDSSEISQGFEIEINEYGLDGDDY
jgi:hypothetical protein